MILLGVVLIEIANYDYLVLKSTSSHLMMHYLKMKKIFFALGIFLIVPQIQAVNNILDYGAIPDSTKTADAFANSQAFQAALDAAILTEDREILIPGNHFTMMPVVLKNIHGLTITVEGTVVLCEDHWNWPFKNNKFDDFMDIWDSSNLHFRGNGLIDGRGYMWWWREILVMNQHERPHMIRMQRVTNLKFEGVKLINSPFYHIYATDIDSFLF